MPGWDGVKFQTIRGEDSRIIINVRLLDHENADRPEARECRKESALR